MIGNLGQIVGQMCALGRQDVMLVSCCLQKLCELILTVVFYSHINKLSDRYIYRASRKLRGAGGKYKYEMSVTVLNATRGDEGMYTCRTEREEDRAYVSSWVTQGSRQTRPTVELISCANKPDKKQRGSRGQFPHRCIDLLRIKMAPS